MLGGSTAWFTGALVNPKVDLTNHVRTQRQWVGGAAHMGPKLAPGRSTFSAGPRRRLSPQVAAAQVSLGAVTKSGHASNTAFWGRFWVG